MLLQLSLDFDIDHWQWTDQLNRGCKPLVDKVRDATLANLAHREVTLFPLKPGDDSGFLQHNQQALNTRFHEMNSDIHWLSLFLHLC